MNYYERWTCILTGISVWLLIGLAGLLQAQGFPVPRAEPEFRELLPFIQGWAQQNAGDEELFKRWSLPFGPLSVQVTKANHGEASSLKNLYLGVSAAAFKVDGRALVNLFHCGPSCVEHRRADLKSKLPRIEPLVSQFRTAVRIHLIANWGMGDDFRVNELFRVMGQQNLTQASPIMGFVPSGTWRPVKDANGYIESLGANPAKVREILKEMRDLSLSALVAETGSVVRVVRVGIADNESGILFAPGDAAPYKKGDKLSDGREVILIEKLEPRVYFYETN
jgi:hypothetical protein